MSDPFWNDLNAAFARRQKAIRYHAKRFEFGFHNPNDEAEVEFFADYDALGPITIRFELTVWSDRRFQFSGMARTRPRGQLWNFEVCGQFKHNFDPAALVSIFEESVTGTSELSKPESAQAIKRLQQLEQNWQELDRRPRLS
ncbi:hypothetical protein V0U79_07860 [Hyphobacterium sp. HN65]|uniref:Uncharacterized protein n=1 Tax=Hyphobacterium lacteum TaxID=3116575 RepID=A0ABU7LQT8_9PROT|nr:hypothetical protein [Hyphobacterium sp. HN65]MEE2526279.1 hypothetical protein [Hyphobacterium sp. HN65]